MGETGAQLMWKHTALPTSLSWRRRTCLISSSTIQSLRKFWPEREGELFVHTFEQQSELFLFYFSFFIATVFEFNQKLPASTSKNLCVCIWFRKLTKAKAPPAAKTKEEKPKGLTLFDAKPPTPKLLKAFHTFRKGGVMEKVMVPSLHTYPSSLDRSTWLLWALRTILY